MEPVVTTLAVAAIALLTACGIVALPWSEPELDASEDAVRAIPALARAAVRAQPAEASVEVPLSPCA